MKARPKIISPQRHRVTETEKPLRLSVSVVSYIEANKQRDGRIKHNYDIVEGPMADDQIWVYVEDFMDGSITREAFWVLAKFKYPTHQIVFCTQKSIEAITYERSYRI